MIPIPTSDENPTYRRPYVTIALIVLNALAWIFELSHGVFESTFDYGLIPSFLLHGLRDGTLSLPAVSPGPIQLHQEVPWPFTLLTSMFMHGGWGHIIGNMWFLWIFGDNVEDAMGPARFSFFYLLCGLVAAFTQALVAPTSQIPMVGASGAIAGVLGAYLILYPHARVRCIWILIIFITRIYVPAWLLLGLWFLSQFLMPGVGVAWMAHVGGFAAGMALVKLFVPPPRRTDCFPPIFGKQPGA